MDEGGWRLQRARRDQVGDHGHARVEVTGVRLLEDSEVAEEPPEDDEDDDGAEAATTKLLCAITGSEAAKQFAHGIPASQDSYRISGRRGSSVTEPLLHCEVRPVNRGTGQVAQLVEQRTENPRVGSSILPLAILLATGCRIWNSF